MAQQITAQLLLRRSSQAEWLAVDPVLALSEPGYETDTQRLKIGDGSTPWSALPYALLPVQEGALLRGLFVPGTLYYPGQYVEGADGIAYVARRKMVANVQPAAGSLWRKTSWGAATGAGAAAGIPDGSSLISEWVEGATYAAQLNVVLFEDNLYYLAFDVERPFTTSDLLEEYEWGLWILIGAGAGAGMVDTSLVLLAEDGRRITDESGQPITVD